MTKNMTEGNTLKLITQFTVPLLVGNLLQQTYNMADAAIVGQVLGGKALAAVGASTSVQFLVLGFCIGTCCGFGIPVAQSFGANHLDRMRKFIFQGIFLVMAAAILLTCACTLLCPTILHILQVPDTIYHNAYIYLLIIFCGIPCCLMYNFLSGILRAVGDSTTPFLSLAISTVLNIGLDWLSIVVFHWGCAGAAIATVTAQGLSGIFCLICIVRKYDILKIRREERRLERTLMGRLMVMGIPMGLQYSITAIGSMVMQSANNSLGDVYISGFTAAMKIKQFVICPFDALSTAVSTFVGQNYGAGKFDRIRKGVLQALAVGIGYGIVIGILVIFGGRFLASLFLSAEESASLDAAAKYLRYMGFFYWALAILNVCRLATQGLGFTGRAVFSGVVEMIARMLVSILLVPVLGYTAICLADQAAWIGACLYIGPTCMYCVRHLSRKKSSV